jgi:hypothetical protein
MAAIKGRKAVSSSAGTSALTRLQKLSVLHFGNRPPIDLTRPRIALTHLVLLCYELLCYRSRKIRRS